MSRQRFANQWNVDLIDQKHAAWQDDPDSVEPDWQLFFEG
jgi:hypothetical protein